MPSSLGTGSAAFPFCRAQAVHSPVGTSLMNEGSGHGHGLYTEAMGPAELCRKELQTTYLAVHQLLSQKWDCTNWQYHF